MAVKGDNMSSSCPPAWAAAWLASLLPPREQETIVGDFLEEYREVILPQRGKLRSELWYIRQTIGFLSEVSWFAYYKRTCIVWLFVFGLGVASGTPVAAVVALLIAGPSCGFFIARRSQLLWAGISAAVIVLLLMFSLGIAVIVVRGVPHPPFKNLLIPVLFTLFSSMVAALIGKCNSERMQKIVFPNTITN